MSQNAKPGLLGKRNRSRTAIDLFYSVSSDTLDASYTHTHTYTIVKSFSIFLKENSAKCRRVQLKQEASLHCVALPWTKKNICVFQCQSKLTACRSPSTESLQRGTKGMCISLHAAQNETLV